jgi:transcriptional regulator with XRE-family HTH domain
MAISEESVGEEDIRLLFAKNLKHLREQQHLSQMQLSGLTGMSFNFINDMEHGNKWFSEKTLAKLCTALKVEPFRFLLDDKYWNANEIDIYRDIIYDSFQKLAGEWEPKYPEDKGEVK